MYIGGALDALTFRRNYFGTQSDVMSLTRDGNVGIGTTNTSTEANLFLGAQGTVEGGQLVLQKGTSQTYATHIDNYTNQLSVMSGTDTGSSTVRFRVDMSNGNVMLGNGAYSPYLKLMTGGRESES